MKIYVASSWRNEFFPEIVSRLRSEGYDVYDFRNPGDGGDGFRWSDVSADWLEWEPQRYRHELMNNPLCQRQFGNDERAMESCDACVLLLPSGRSAHTEAGWFAGKGKKVSLTVLPNRNYKKVSLSVKTKSGKKIKLTKKNSAGTKYTFIMPDEKVIVSAGFAKK